MSLTGCGVCGVPKSREKLEAGLAVRNAFNAPIVAGMVAAVCGGKEADFDWESPEPGVLVVKVKGT